MKPDLAVLFEQVKRQKKSRLFKTIYQCSCVQLYGVILRIVKQEQAAEEVMQETYVKIWHNLERYDIKQAKPMTWMMRIAHNQAIDYLRKIKSNNDDDSILHNMADERTGIYTLIEHEQDITRLSVCLKRLQKNVDGCDSILKLQ